MTDRVTLTETYKTGKGAGIIVAESGKVRGPYKVTVVVGDGRKGFKAPKTRKIAKLGEARAALRGKLGPLRKAKNPDEVIRLVLGEGEEATVTETINPSYVPGRAGSKRKRDQVQVFEPGEIVRYDGRNGFFDAEIVEWYHQMDPYYSDSRDLSDRVKGAKALIRNLRTGRESVVDHFEIREKKENPGPANLLSRSSASLANPLNKYYFQRGTGGLIRRKGRTYWVGSLDKARDEARRLSRMGKGVKVTILRVEPDGDQTAMGTVGSVGNPDQWGLPISSDFQKGDRVTYRGRTSVGYGEIMATVIGSSGQHVRIVTDNEEELDTLPENLRYHARRGREIKYPGRQRNPANMADAGSVGNPQRNSPARSSNPTAERLGLSAADIRKITKIWDSYIQGYPKYDKRGASYNLRRYLDTYRFFHEDGTPYQQWEGRANAEDLPVEVLWHYVKPMVGSGVGYTITKDPRWKKLDIWHRGQAAFSDKDLREMERILTQLDTYGYITFLAAGSVWEITPAGKQRNPRMVRNPANMADADRLYEDFHGRPPTQTTKVVTRTKARTDLAELGPLTELKIHLLTGKRIKLPYEVDCDDQVMLCSSPDGRQLYFVGGDQTIDLRRLGMAGREWVKDSMVLGVLEMVTYRTEKGFDKFKLTDYYHELGEESGMQPLLMYDNINGLLSVAGGQYEVRPEGIVN